MYEPPSQWNSYSKERLIRLQQHKFIWLKKKVRKGSPRFSCQTLPDMGVSSFVQFYLNQIKIQNRFSGSEPIASHQQHLTTQVTVGTTFLFDPNKSITSRLPACYEATLNLELQCYNVWFRSKEIFLFESNNILPNQKCLCHGSFPFPSHIKFLFEPNKLYMHPLKTRCESRLKK